MSRFSIQLIRNEAKIYSLSVHSNFRYKNPTLGGIDRR